MQAEDQSFDSEHDNDLYILRTRQVKRSESMQDGSMVSTPLIYPDNQINTVSMATSSAEDRRELPPRFYDLPFS